MADLPEGLLDDIKDYLNITWQDDKIDKKITGFINRGMKRLQDVAGASLDFEKEDLPRSLLLDYCRYANSQALEVFETNFQSELLELNFISQYIYTLTVISLAGATAGNTVITVSPVLLSGNGYVYCTGQNIVLPATNDLCNTTAGYIAWDGLSEITATIGNEIAIVEVDSTGAAKRAGKTTVTVKA